MDPIVKYPDFTQLDALSTPLREYARLKCEQGAETGAAALIGQLTETMRCTVRLLQELPDDAALSACEPNELDCALPGFVDSKNEEKTERNAGYLVVSHSGGGMLRQGTRKGIRRTPANRGMRAHWVVKGLDISEDVCHGMCP